MIDVQNSITSANIILTGIGSLIGALIGYFLGVRSKVTANRIAIKESAIQEFLLCANREQREVSISQRAKGETDQIAIDRLCEAFARVQMNISTRQWRSMELKWERYRHEIEDKPDNEAVDTMGYRNKYHAVSHLKSLRDNCRELLNRGN